MRLGIYLGACACACVCVGWLCYKNLKRQSEVGIYAHFEFPRGLHLLASTDESDFSRFSIFSTTDLDRMNVELMFASKLLIDEHHDRAIGCFVGNLIGDALGAPFEFSSVRYGVKEMQNGFQDSNLWQYSTYNKFRLKPGQWTDDGSMTLCLADSLITYPDFNPFDLRMRFLQWKVRGYCNAFGYDNERENKASVGLGGNINDSLKEFVEMRTPYTTAGDKNTSGNGSLMRNSPICVCFWKEKEKAMELSIKQSKTTHQGTEAYLCCKLLTYICVTAIALGKDASRLTVLENLSEFCQLGLPEETEAVHGIALSKNEGFDRNWNWKSENYQFSPSRTQHNPGYVGSYSMDALSMALHCVWTTSSFKEALLKAANLRGDSDTVSAITGQIAGAIYGYQNIPKEWIEAILKWDPLKDILLRAYKMFKISKQL